MKQTAIDWLYDQIENKGKCIYEIIDQARAMEKEQIIEAFDKGLITENVYYGYDDEKAERYYDETFKSE